MQASETFRYIPPRSPEGEGTGVRESVVPVHALPVHALEPVGGYLVELGESEPSQHLRLALVKQLKQMIGGAQFYVVDVEARSRLAGQFLSSSTGASFDALKNVYESRLRRLLAEFPVEDGVVHPSEDLLLEISSRHGVRAVPWIGNLLKILSSAEAEGLLRCLGRVLPASMRSDVMEIMRKMLSSSSVGIRDAAVCALELWGGESSKRLLEAHSKVEPEQWLAEYSARVAAQLP